MGRRIRQCDAEVSDMLLQRFVEDGRIALLAVRTCPGVIVKQTSLGWGLVL